MLRIHKNRHIDDIVVHHTKYVKTAQLGEVFQAEHIPYKFIMKIKRLKMIKYISTNKVDLSNLKTLEHIIKHHSKMLSSLLNYGPWFKSQIEKMKLNVLKIKEVKISAAMEDPWHILHKLKNIKHLTIEIPSETGFDEGSLLRTLNRKQLRLPKLKIINIQGNCTHIFDKIITILNRNIHYFTSLEEIKLNMVYKIQNTQLEKMIPTMKIFSHIKEIRLGLWDQGNIIFSLIKYAKFFPHLETLQGPLGMESELDFGKLAEFKNLKTFDLFIPRHLNMKGGLAKIISTSRISQSLKILKICFVYLEAQLIEEVFCQDQMTNENLSSLNQLESIALTIMSVQSQIKSEHILKILKLCKRAKNLKNLSLDISNSSDHLGVQTKESPSLTEMFNIMSDLIPNLQSLVLKLPVISISDLQETFKFDNLSELVLHGYQSLESSGKLKHLLSSLNKNALKRLTLSVVILQEPKEIVEQLTSIGEFTHLTKLSLSYKNLDLEDGLLPVEDFKSLSERLTNLNFLLVKTSTSDRSAKFDLFEKRLNHYFAHVEVVKFESSLKI